MPVLQKLDEYNRDLCGSLHCHKYDWNRRTLFLFLTAVLLKFEVFWDVTPCRLVNA